MSLGSPEPSLPDASAADIKALMTSTAKDIGDNTEWYGSGLLQLNDAVKK